MRRPLGPGAVALIGTLAAVVLFVGTILAYGRREVFATGPFTQRAVDVVHQEATREQLARTLAKQAVEAGNPDLIAIRPLVESTTSRLIESGAADPLISVAVSEMHRSLFSAESGPVVVGLSDVLVLARGVLSALNPAAASAIPTASSTGAVKVADRDTTAWVRRADVVRSLGIVLPISAIGLLLFAVVLARERRRAVTVVGIAVAGAGMLVAVVMSVLRPLVVSRFDGQAQDVAREVWVGMLGDLAWWGLALVGFGALIAGAGAAVLPEFDVAAIGRRVWRVVTATPRGPLGFVVRGARGAAAIALGFLAVTDADAATRLVFVVVGAIAILWGISELLRLLVSISGAQRTPAQEAALRRRHAIVGASVIGIIATAGLLALGGIALATSGDGEAPPDPPNGCNGHPELCDRTLAQVAMVTSHNAMSVASDPGWFNAHHYNPLIRQLDAGVRGLLIDTHLGQETLNNGFGGTRLVQTDLPDTSRAELEAAIGAESVAAAERLTGSILYGESVAVPNLYLCHGLCELGATDAVAQYVEIRRWLEDHPSEVIVIVIEDHATVDDDVAALERSGLADRAWPERLAAGRPLPTLQQMIDAGKTALIMHESRGSTGPAWYQDAYAITQETPYAFPDMATITSAKSCVPNRGESDAPLFLLNHWLDGQPVEVSAAEQTNTREVLLDRARLCQKERGLLPNLVAINFVEIGAAFDVVDELNGVAAPPPPGG